MIPDPVVTGTEVHHVVSCDLVIGRVQVLARDAVGISRIAECVHWYGRCQFGNQRHQAVFVGGAVVSLYVNDPAADEVRPTKDIDIALEIVSLGQLERLRQDLAIKGFFPDPEETVICRFVYKDIRVDVMSTNEVGWVPANKWFLEGFTHLEKITLENDLSINILPLTFFLASKFEAFHSRGGTDPRTSHDLEDIIYLLDNRLDLSSSILSSPNKVQSYLRSEFSSLISHSMDETVLSHMNPFSRKERYLMLIEKLKSILLE